MAGAECCKDPPTLDSSSGNGQVDKVAGFDAYLTGSAVSDKAILLVSDVFGFEAPNLRKLADKVAAAGFYVVVPDFFHGDPYNPEDKDRQIQVWIKDHGADKGLENAKSMIEELKTKGISSIGAAGFCWGAKVVAGLAVGELIQAAVMLHPSFVTVDDIKGLKAPTAILGAEIDKISPPELLKEFEEILASKPEIDGYVKIYPNVVHGWTVRYNVEDEIGVKLAEDAHGNMLDWFAKYVK